MATKHYYCTWQTGIDSKYEYCPRCHTVRKKEDTPTNPIPSQAATLVALAGHTVTPEPPAHVLVPYVGFPTAATPVPAPTPPEPEPAAPRPTRKELREWLTEWASNHNWPGLTLDIYDTPTEIAPDEKAWRIWLKYADLHELVSTRLKTYRCDALATSPATRPEPPAPTKKPNKRKELRAWLEDWSKRHEYPALILRGDYGTISGTVVAGPENWTAWLNAAKVSELEQGQVATLLHSDGHQGQHVESEQA